MSSLNFHSESAATKASTRLNEEYDVEREREDSMHATLLANILLIQIELNDDDVCVCVGVCACACAWSCPSVPSVGAIGV